MSLSFKLGTEVKQRAVSDWHIQGVPCQSYTQSISSSQSVLFVCWICFGTCWPLIDMGAGAGKTLLWCGANNALSVTLPQMFGPRAYTGIIVVQKPGRFLSCSHSLSSRFISVIQTALNKNDRPHLYLDPPNYRSTLGQGFWPSCVSAKDLQTFFLLGWFQAKWKKRLKVDV